MICFVFFVDCERLTFDESMEHKRWKQFMEKELKHCEGHLEFIKTS